MQLLAKAFALILALCALIAPVVATANCSDSDCIAGADECVCVCHPQPTQDHKGSATLAPKTAERLRPIELSSANTYLSADIFRPPIAC